MIPQQQILQARSTNLFELLTQRGYTLSQEGTQYRVVGHAGLIIHQNEWYHHSLSTGGNAIDLLIHLEGLSFKQAVYELSTDMFSTKYDDCLHYLVKKRRIDQELIDDLLALKLMTIKENTINFHGYQNQTSLNDLGDIKCNTWINIKNKTRGESKGSDKSYSFSLPNYNNYHENIIIIAESPLDALSIACMEKIKTDNDYYQTHKIALCGTNHKNLEQRIKALKPSRIKLALDNDPAGKRATSSILKILKDIAPIEIIYYKFKDPNELLQSLK